MKKKELFIAVDAGKMFAKTAYYDPDTEYIGKFRFKTKTGEGNMDDDALEEKTFIMTIGGKTYKIGNGASTPAEMVTSKKTETHKLCTLAAIALCVDSYGEADVHVILGMPIDEYRIVEKRIEYRDFILPDGNITIAFKKKSENPEKKVSFTIVSKSVCPEGAGALYLDMNRYARKSAAVVDIGNLNAGLSMWDNFEPQYDLSKSSELGGNMLCSKLSQELSAAFGRVSKNMALWLLTQEKEDRKLTPNNKDPEVENKSREMIHDIIIRHLKQVKEQCDTLQWSLGFTELAFIGGTTRVIADEIREVFGDNVFIPQNPEFANAFGLLRRLCAKKLGKIIHYPENTGKEEQAEKTA